MKLYVTDVTEGVRETLDNTLDYIIRESYIEYAAAFLEDYNTTLRRLQREAGALAFHRIPYLASLGYKEIRFSKHDWYFLFTVDENIAMVKILANDKQDIEALVRMTPDEE